RHRLFYSSSQLSCLHPALHSFPTRRSSDLISIHADAFMTPNPQGASVFALSTKGASSAAARWMAKKENAADLVGGVNLKTKDARSEEHTSELQSRENLVCRLLLEKKKQRSR